MSSVSLHFCTFGLFDVLMRWILMVTVTDPAAELQENQIEDWGLMVNVKHTRNSFLWNAAVIVFREILLTPLISNILTSASEHWTNNALIVDQKSDLKSTNDFIISLKTCLIVQQILKSNDENNIYRCIINYLKI